MNIKKFAASDFPGIDEAKFKEWKTLHIKDNGEQRIVSYIALAIGYILTLLFFKSFYTFLIFLTIFVIAGYGFYRVKNARLRQLGKELKMSDRLWAKKKGRAFTEQPAGDGPPPEIHTDTESRVAMYRRLLGLMAIICIAVWVPFFTNLRNPHSSGTFWAVVRILQGLILIVWVYALFRMGRKIRKLKQGG